MPNYVAICTDIEQFNNNKILELEFAKNYPGAGWMPLFAQMMKDEGCTVITGDVAIQLITKGECVAKDVLVIQELDAKHAITLIELGAVPLVLTCFEAPLYAYEFYDSLEKFKDFKYKILFKGSHTVPLDDFNQHSYFPTYFKENVRAITPWENRKETVMVISNKFCKNPFPRNMRRGHWKNWLKVQNSKSRKYSIKNEFQTTRLKAIEFFAKKNKLDLFGMGWDKRERLPLLWKLRLKNTLDKLNAKPCDDKVETILNYKFCICYENMSYSGYITEKIIDCFVAGTIPIYLGALDITDFVPENAFINVRKFKSLKDVNKYINLMTEEEALDMLNEGRKFLTSKEGQFHCYENFAQNIKDIIIKYIIRIRFNI